MDKRGYWFNVGAAAGVACTAEHPFNDEYEHSVTKQCAFFATTMRAHFTIPPRVRCLTELLAFPGARLMRSRRGPTAPLAGWCRECESSLANNERLRGLCRGCDVALRYRLARVALVSAYVARLPTTEQIVSNLLMRAPPRCVPCGALLTHVGWGDYELFCPQCGHDNGTEIDADGNPTRSRNCGPT